MVIVGIFVGPSVVSCFGSNNMGLCLRDRMVDAGLFPRTDTAVTQEPQVAPTAPATAPVEAPATPPSPVETPAPATPATAAPTQSSESIVAATFGLLRAEPDGSMVIAGSGTPGSEVNVFSNGDLLGSAKVESSGDWVIVPDAPIAPGGTELTLGEAGKQGQSEQSFVVIINPDKRTEPLVVASTPGTASEVLQGLTPAAGALAAISAATATPAPPAAVAAATPATTAPLATTAAPAETPAPVAATPTPVAPAVVAPDATPPAQTAVAAATPATTPVTPAPTPVTPAAVPLQATIDAIEIEGDRTFFAGSGPNGASVRLYVDGSFVADSLVKDGRWLVEAGKVLTKSVQRIRADLLQAGSATVASRAEVDFEVDLPSAVAQATTPTTPAPVTADAPTVAPAAPAGTPPPAATTATATPDAAPAAATPSDVPTMVASAVGDPEAQRFASGKAIIRTGDNLWTIARRVYGTGIKYTTIYEANTSQIRDPDRIYPGQVFDLPGD